VGTGLGRKGSEQKNLAKISGHFHLKSKNFLLAAPVGTARFVLYDNFIMKKLLAENVEKLLFIHHN
jgi:hypothetical protein